MISAMRLSAVASSLGAELRGDDVSFDSVSTDTRTLQRGDLYVAIRGIRFDGNEYVREAGARGACGAVVDRYTPINMPQLLVEDTTVALGKLGKMNRLNSRAVIIGVTGSQGKTTVKEMIGAILGECGDTLVTRGNLNNQYGVPMTLLSLAAHHSFGVIEMGANHQGEIAYCAGLVAPAIAVISNAARAHIEGFGSLDGVAKGKGEIIDAVIPGGTMVLNADDRYYGLWKARAHRLKTVSFSIAGPAADFYATSIKLGSRGLEFTLQAGNGSATVRLALIGTHNVANALAAAAVSVAAGASLEQVVTGLGKLRPVAGRMNPVPGINGSQVIDDSYNASPDSVRAAIDALARYGGHRVLLLGDMAELGNAAPAVYQEVADYARDAGIDELWTLGRDSRQSADRFGDRARHFVSKQAAIERARDVLEPGVTLLLKGSRSAGVDEVVSALISSN